MAIDFTSLLIIYWLSCFKFLSFSVILWLLILYRYMRSDIFFIRKIHSNTVCQWNLIFLIQNYNYQHYYITCVNYELVIIWWIYRTLLTLFKRRLARLIFIDIDTDTLKLLSVLIFNKRRFQIIWIKWFL